MVVTTAEFASWPPQSAPPSSAGMDCRGAQREMALPVSFVAGVALCPNAGMHAETMVQLLGHLPHRQRAPARNAALFPPRKLERECAHHPALTSGGRPCPQPARQQAGKGLAHHLDLGPVVW